MMEGEEKEKEEEENTVTSSSIWMIYFTQKNFLRTLDLDLKILGSTFCIKFLLTKAQKV